MPDDVRREQLADGPRVSTAVHRALATREFLEDLIPHRTESGGGPGSLARPGRCWRRRDANPSPPWATAWESACRRHGCDRRTCAPPAREQCPVNAPSACTNVVEGGRPLEPQHRDPGGDQRAGRERRDSGPPASGACCGCGRSEAGLVQTGLEIGTLRQPEEAWRGGSRRARTSPELGGVSPNALNASTQESCAARRQVRTWRYVPPRSDPLRTVTSPPSSIAETMPAAHGGAVVDAPPDEPLQVVAALRVAEEDEPAPAADPPQERVEGLLDVAVGGPVVTARRPPRLQRRDGGLAVQRRVDPAVLREARGLVERDRADLGVGPLRREPGRLVGDRGIDVEAVDAAVAAAAGRDPTGRDVPAPVARRAQARAARVVGDARAAQPFRRGRCAAGGAQRRDDGRR